MSTLRPYDPVRRVEILGELWQATKGSHKLIAQLRTHPLGWELRASVGLEIHRSQIAKTEQEVSDVSDAWKTEAVKKGWTVT